MEIPNPYEESIVRKFTRPIWHKFLKGIKTYDLIQEGDKILKINGKHIYNYRELLLFMQLENDGKPIELKMKRADGEVYTVTVTPKAYACPHVRKNPVRRLTMTSALMSAVERPTWASRASSELNRACAASGCTTSSDGSSSLTLVAKCLGLCAIALRLPGYVGKGSA